MSHRLEFDAVGFVFVCIFFLAQEEDEDGGEEEESHLSKSRTICSRCDAIA